MTLAAREDLAMILPIPVPKGSREDVVRFINLEAYADFFSDMRRGFPPLMATAPAGRAVPLAAAKKLAVVPVGSFEASFVPSSSDFARLDERFRLPSEVWQALPLYKDYGFAVFKLKNGEHKIHPMAFEFPRANPDHLFFPTVHIHDGKVHAKARFDHSLYCQRSAQESMHLTDWQESRQPAGLFMKIDKAKGLLDPEEHCYLKELRGNLRNEDTLV
jgi:hypothetical protein